MSRSSSNNNMRSSRLDLQLNLSPPQRMEVDDDAHDNDASDGSLSSSPSSCVSSDGQGSSSPDAAAAKGAAGKSPMVIGACTRCLMYCMVAKKDYPTCLNCKKPFLVDLLDEDKKRNMRN